MSSQGPEPVKHRPANARGRWREGKAAFRVTRPYFPGDALISEHSESRLQRGPTGKGNPARNLSSEDRLYLCPGQATLLCFCFPMMWSCWTDSETFTLKNEPENDGFQAAGPGVGGRCGGAGMVAGPGIRPAPVHAL